MSESERERERENTERERERTVKRMRKKQRKRLLRTNHAISANVSNFEEFVWPNSTAKLNQNLEPNPPVKHSL